MIAIIDYGMGNLRSVQKGLERAGCEAVVTRDIGADSIRPRRRAARCRRVQRLHGEPRQVRSDRADSRQSCGSKNRF